MISHDYSLNSTNHKVFNEINWLKIVRTLEFALSWISVLRLSCSFTIPHNQNTHLFCGKNTFWNTDTLKHSAQWDPRFLPTSFSVSHSYTYLPVYCVWIFVYILKGKDCSNIYSSFHWSVRGGLVSNVAPTLD